MPLPNNFLSNVDNQAALQQLSASNNGVYESRTCPDARFARLINGIIHQIPDTSGNTSTKNRDIVLYSNNGAFVVANENLKNVIAIILESPHVDEFANYVAPAMGRTGDYFFSHFNRLFAQSCLYASLSKNIDYDMVFVNSVQYQTSCGAVPLSKYCNKKRRDKNWVNIFQSSSSSDLKKRLNALRPVLVLNLCTKGIENLNSMVDTEIRPLYGTSYTVGNHPSYWNHPNAKIS